MRERKVYERPSNKKAWLRAVWRFSRFFPRLDPETDAVQNGRIRARGISKRNGVEDDTPQRGNRQRVAAVARGKSVLNLFGYTGGFAVYAATSSA